MVAGEQAACAGSARDTIYGAARGTIITFTTIAGTVGAGLPERAALVVGLASLAATGFALSAGNYRRTKAARRCYEHVFAITGEQTRLEPTGDSLKGALSMFAVIVLCGLVPLITYPAGLLACILGTASTLFAIGAVGGRLSRTRWWQSGFDTSIIGMSAAALAFGAGHTLTLFINIPTYY